MERWNMGTSAMVVLISLLAIACGPTDEPAGGEMSSFPLPTGGSVEMVYVPAGAFTMGSEDGEDRERPLREVHLDGYWIDRTEVTNDHFAAFVADTGYVTTAEDEGYGDEIPLVGGGFETHVARE